MVILETERLRIHVASDEEMLEFIHSQNIPELKTAYREMYEGSISHPKEREWYAIWVIERKDGIQVGEFCFKGIRDDGTVEIGYGIREDFQNNGYATEAVKSAISWTLKQPMISSVEAETTEDNAASLRVLEKCGFRYSGKRGEEGPRFSLKKRNGLPDEKQTD